MGTLAQESWRELEREWHSEGGSTGLHAALIEGICAHAKRRSHVGPLPFARSDPHCAGRAIVLPQVLLFSDGENNATALPDGVPDWGARMAVELQMRGFYGPIHTFALSTPTNPNNAFFFAKDLPTRSAFSLAPNTIQSHVARVACRPRSDRRNRWITEPEWSHSGQVAAFGPTDARGHMGRGSNRAM